ncbi:hypothetical protein Daus18300_007947 [Diaporthe australafricana]|uniref:Major facilitator superfamily (MFS) profile domain-containing protein n=1 Tax=Diaporthe australafricana TaxID=127596 RepID=A0ABR3WKI0_9PEZI
MAVDSRKYQNSPTAAPILSESKTDELQGYSNAVEVAEVTNDTQESQESRTPESRTYEGTAHSGSPPPPDGGLVAWLHVLAGFMLLLNSWGIINTYGVFQSYYESGVLFKATSSQISWIGSAQAFFIMFSGIVTGPLYDRGYVRALLVTGGFLIVGGHVALSFCSAYWQVLLAQGICAGLGEGCLFVPTISILPTYFKARLGLAVGLANAGASLGGVVFPLMLSRLLYHVGFAWAVRAMALISLITLSLAISIVKMRFRPEKPRRPIDPTAFSDWPFMVLVLATLLAMMGVVALQFYVAYFAEYFDIFDTNWSISLVAIYNAASFVGRILPNYLSDKIGVFNLISPAAAINGIVIFCLTVVRTKAATVVIAVITGFLSGMIIAMPPVCIALLTKNKALIGTRMGTCFGIVSLGLLACGPGAGGILGTDEPLRWTALWVYCGTSLLFGSLLYAVIRTQKAGFKVMVTV